MCLSFVGVDPRRTVIIRFNTAVKALVKRLYGDRVESFDVLRDMMMHVPNESDSASITTNVADATMSPSAPYSEDAAPEIAPVPVRPIPSSSSLATHIASANGSAYLDYDDDE